MFVPSIKHMLFQAIIQMVDQLGSHYRAHLRIHGFLINFPKTMTFLMAFIIFHPHFPHKNFSFWIGFGQGKLEPESPPQFQNLGPSLLSGDLRSWIFPRWEISRIRPTRYVVVNVPYIYGQVMVWGMGLKFSPET